MEGDQNFTVEGFGWRGFRVAPRGSSRCPQGTAPRLPREREVRLFWFQGERDKACIFLLIRESERERQGFTGSRKRERNKALLIPGGERETGVSWTVDACLPRLC